MDSETYIGKLIGNTGQPDKLTAALREGILKGRQVYYAYDQRWTPDGHEAVADALLPYLKGDLLSGLRSATAAERTTGGP